MFFRPTEGERLPDCEAVYLGGGYPEVHAELLEGNSDFLEGLRQMSEQGALVYGECGGMMVMCRSIDAFSRPAAWRHLRCPGRPYQGPPRPGICEGAGAPITSFSLGWTSAS